MKVRNLLLENYRNYDSLKISFNDNLNILIGDNAQGKTNILESIYVIALTKSIITNDDKNLIKLSKDYTKIKSDVTIGEDNKLLEIIINKNGKKVKVNNKEIKRLSDYVSKLNVIFFGPNDLKLIKDTPMFRRKFLNTEISQIANLYLKKSNDYNILLKNRNEFLKLFSNDYDKNYLDVIDMKYIELNYEIYKYRNDFIVKLNEYIGNIFYEITGNVGLEIVYNSVFNNGDSEDEKKDYFCKKLHDNLERELLYKTTLIGVHRDDFSFYLEGKDVLLYGSQGQQKAAVLSLKLAEIKIFKEKTNDNPIVLLDDIFSEFDLKCCNKLIKYITNDIQTIITTTDIENINNELLKKARIFKIIAGKLEEEENDKNE